MGLDYMRTVAEYLGKARDLEKRSVRCKDAVARLNYEEIASYLRYVANLVAQQEYFRKLRPDDAFK